MTPTQDQAAEENAVAIQSGRDTNIHHGVGVEEMKQIIEAIASQQVAYTAIARDVADARCADLETRIIERFTQPGAARVEAFRDPDFQYLIGRSQHAYARSGDENVRDTLGRP